MYKSKIFTRVLYHKIGCQVKLFLEDKEFDKGSDINIKKLSKKEIQDLALTGKIWGFVKYYHPRVREGNFNFDYELFRLLPKILKASDKNERNNFLYQWVEKFGSFSPQKFTKPISQDLKAYSDLAFLYDTEELGEKLQDKLNKILRAEREEENYFISLYF